ncbi:hypothetical protein GCM10011514_49770 [Emticicia aquatilis]|uniref:Uncharacterized protein n=1 Tax=Emticicia aquatilis TaxID=1537369 RepID=A0A917DX29_9BACT|nr:hypothetical protein [Emticicia aquatilis]GGD79829.1 hypothetical protein GCM10011514_49770 [Emticicia aquatilis]
MKYFLETLKYRNESLFYFGLLCFVLAIIFLILTRFTTTQVYNVNAWYKPFKFAASTTLYAWAMAWFIGYLPNFNARIFNWVIIITLGFEIIYIAWQASRGMLSHFNVSTSFYSFMYSMMALAATIATLATAYIGILFFKNDFPNLPLHYVWSIRLGIFLFVVFAFEGFVMGSRMTHTIGGQDGGEGIPILNWSTQYGDPRIAHFIGMHALQVLPILSYYVFRNITFTVIIAILYGLVAVFSLVKALQGKLIIG